MAKALNPLVVWGLLRELGAGAEAKPVSVSGPLAEQLVKGLAAGAAPGAVRVGGRPEEAGVVVRVLAGAPTDDDAAELRAAKRAKTPVLAVQTAAETFDVPYVLATDVVVCRPGEGFPLEEIAGRIADRLGEEGTALAARVPLLRGPVCDALVEKFARQNGIAAVAIFVPGADFPVLTLNQLRLVLRLAAAHGIEVDQQRLPEILATIGAGLGFRAVARQLLGAVPVAGWAVKGAIAYGGTRALGEAARRYFESLGGAKTPA